MIGDAGARCAEIAGDLILIVDRVGGVAVITVAR